MAQELRTLTFTDGVASKVTLPVGTYTYNSDTIPGYKNATMESFTITSKTTSLDLEITAAGLLKVNVVDDLGTKITAGKLQLSNVDKTVTYGEEQEISDGEAEFANVPYLDTTGINFYVAQDGSDEEHLPLDQPQAVSMKEESQTETIENARKPVMLNLTLKDANYEDITPITGDLVVLG